MSEMDVKTTGWTVRIEKSNLPKSWLIQVELPKSNIKLPKSQWSICQTA